MIRETYKGRKLKVVKNRDTGGLVGSINGQPTPARYGVPEQVVIEQFRHDIDSAEAVAEVLRAAGFPESRKNFLGKITASGFRVSRPEWPPQSAAAVHTVHLPGEYGTRTDDEAAAVIAHDANMARRYSETLSQAGYHVTVTGRVALISRCDSAAIVPNQEG